MNIEQRSISSWLSEDETDLRYIQTLLGHESSKTTEIYTHGAIHSIKHLKSPLDSLGLE